MTFWQEYIATIHKHLETLLNAVHDDDGQYTAEHGLVKSVQDAVVIIDDARRYQWLKSRVGLTLRSDGSTWTRRDGTKFKASHYLAADGTQYPAYETLDDAIDQAIIADYR